MLVIKKLALISAMLIFAFTLSLTCLAFTEVHEYVIDNDETDPDDIGIYTSQYGFDEIITSTYLYNGDARAHTTVNQSFYTYDYNWYFPSYTRSSGMKVHLRVYLRNAQFNDPSAKYSISSTGSSYHVSTINQDTATIGWNDLGTITINNNFTANHVTLTPSNHVESGTTFKCGADAIDVTLGY